MALLQTGQQDGAASCAETSTIPAAQLRQIVWEHGSSLGACDIPSYSCIQVPQVKKLSLKSSTSIETVSIIIGARPDTSAR
jgi:hypothetical protein